MRILGALFVAVLFVLFIPAAGATGGTAGSCGDKYNTIVALGMAFYEVEGSNGVVYLYSEQNAVVDLQRGGVHPVTGVPDSCQTTQSPDILVATVP